MSDEPDEISVGHICKIVDMGNRLDGALVEITDVLDTPQHYSSRVLNSELHVRLLPEYEDRWAQPGFWLPPPHLVLQRHSILTAEELEAAKQRTTEVLRELESLP